MINQPILRSHVQCWDLPSILIKPMQRILKYPLLPGDLVKYTEDDHPDKKHLISASKLMGEIANQINEVKRRKDLGTFHVKYTVTMEQRIFIFSYYSIEVSRKK